MPFYPADWASTMQPAIWTWVDGVLGTLAPSWTTIWADAAGPGQTEQGPVPSRPLCTLGVLSRPIEETRSVESGIEVGATMTSRRRTGGRFALLINLHARNSAEVGEAESYLRHSVAGGGTHVENLEVAGLVPAEPILVRDLTAIQGARREFRSELEIPMRLEIRTELTNQPWIETVDPVSVTLTE